MFSLFNEGLGSLWFMTEPFTCPVNVSPLLQDLLNKNQSAMNANLAMSSTSLSGQNA